MSTPGVPADDDAAKLQRLEAVLLVAREPQQLRRLSMLAGLADGTEAKTLIRELNARYDDYGRSFRVEPVAGGWLMVTRPQFANWIRQLDGRHAERRLSAPAMETLAVIAYRQPVTRAEIESVRGVRCGEVIRQLLERGLVRMAGRSDELGRPFLYATTRLFLRHFGLDRLESLPRRAAFRDSLLTNTQPVAENSSTLTGTPSETNDLGSPSASRSPAMKEPAVKIASIPGRPADESWALEAAEEGMPAPVVAPRSEDDEFEEDDYDDDSADDEEFEDDFEEDDDFEEEDDEFEEEDDDYDDEDDDDWEEVTGDDDEEEDDEFDDEEDDEFDDDDDDDEFEDEEDDDWD